MAAEDIIKTEEETAPTGLRLGASDQAAAEEMQSRIIETAETLFRRFGYQKTTVADIAEELSMSSANVYRFFASKAAICEAVLRKISSEARVRIREAIDAPGLTATERLRRVVTSTHEEVAQRCITDKLMHTMVHAAVTQNWKVVDEHHESIRKMMAAIIAEGAATGEFDVQNADAASHCFQAAMISACHPLILENRLQAGEDVDAAVEPMLEFALRALGARDLKTA